MPEPGIRRVGHASRLPWLAEAYDARTQRRKRKQFRTLAEARAWRQDVQAAIRKGEVRVTVTPTLREASAALIDGKRSGAIPARGGHPYRASVVRKYEATLERYVLPDLGARRVGEITHMDLLDHADRLRANGLAPNTVRRAFDPIRVVMRRAVQRGWIGANPCASLELPTGMVRPRERVLEPAEIAVLLEALADTRDRALWAAPSMPDSGLESCGPSDGSTSISRMATCTSARLWTTARPSHHPRPRPASEPCR
jgi:hypothetical protein